jgi:hypothetical protein
LAGDERWQLVERIAASSPFQRSTHLRELLLYLTERTLHGHADQLSEQKIGHAIFGKPADYTPLEDSSVRVHARQLRLRLHEYFDSVERSETLVVEIPKGSYVPVFRSARTAKTDSGISGQEAPARRSTLPILIPWVLSGILALACALLWQRLESVHNAGALQVQTKPPWPLSEVLDGQHRTCIVVADVNYGMLRILGHKPGSLEDYLKPGFPQDFIPPDLKRKEATIINYIENSVLTSYADVAVLSFLKDLGGADRDRIFVRPARDLRLRDLDEGNYVFIGSPGSNPWVQLFENRLNFQETEGLVGEGPKAFLNKSPRQGERHTYEGLRWTGTAGEDYADIALLPNEQHDTAILILQGLQQEGTEAAGRFLADPNSRRELRAALGLSGDPKEKVWFEALIRTKAVAGAPNSETVAAVRLIH